MSNKSQKPSELLVEDAELIFKNFGGEVTTYNQKGDRTFGLILTDELADSLTKDGWNVKRLRDREDADEGWTPPYFLPVAVSFKVRAPTIVVITSTGRRYLSEGDVSALDYADVINIDLLITPYSWEMNDKTGIKAYLKSMYVTIQEDPLELKYAIQD